MGHDAADSVEIVGVGIVSSAGVGVDLNFAAACRGDAVPQAPKSIQSELGARFPVFEVPDAAFRRATMRLPGGRDRRALRIARLAAAEAFTTGLVDVPAGRIGVIVGATVGGMNGAEEVLETGGALRRRGLRHLVLWDVPRDLADYYGFGGPAFATSSACTSGTQAIALGADLIASGACDVVLAGGVDCISKLTYHGFASLGLLAEGRCTPFDARRSGLNLGEAGAFVVLARNGVVARPLARLTGWCSTADAFHATAPRPDGSGVAAAFRGALDVAGVGPRDIGWVHAHGTATPNNDAVESAAIRAVFGELPVPVSSTKHVFGHTLGAAGAVSCVLAVAATQRGVTPGNAAITTPDPACTVFVLPPEGQTGSLEHVLVSSLGFGGASCALVVSAVRE